MKSSNPKPSTPKTAVSANDPRIAFRMDPAVAPRFYRVVKASKRSKTSILEECIEQVLPKLEKQYLQSEAA